MEDTEELSAIQKMQTEWAEVEKNAWKIKSEKERKIRCRVPKDTDIGGYATPPKAVRTMSTMVGCKMEICSTKEIKEESISNVYIFSF